MKYLIVTADDFGLSKSINEGIVKAHRDGIVTSISLMPAGWAFEDALERAKAIGLKEAGAHLALTETSALTEPSKVPTLAAKNGKFQKNHIRFFLNLFLKRIDRGHIYVELREQLNRIKNSGITVTNISSHEHIHMMPAILDIFIELAKEYKIPAIRFPRNDRLFFTFGAKKIVRKLILLWMEQGMNKMLKNSSLAYTDNFLGFLDSGNLREETLTDMLESLSEGVTELVCHPGFLSPEVLDRCIFYSDCETELAALTSRKVKNLIADKGIRLIRYGEFIDGAEGGSPLRPA